MTRLDRNRLNSSHQHSPRKKSPNHDITIQKTELMFSIWKWSRMSLSISLVSYILLETTGVVGVNTSKHWLSLLKIQIGRDLLLRKTPLRIVHTILCTVSSPEVLMSPEDSDDSSIPITIASDPTSKRWLHFLLGSFLMSWS